MAIYKNANLDISVSAEQNPNYNAKPSVQFSTQDKNTAKYTFTVKQNNKPVDLTGVTASVTLFSEDKSVFQSDATITSATEGKIEYVIPAEAIRHHGKTRGDLRLTYPNGDVLGGLRFSFNIEQALIDRAAGVIGGVYIRDFEQLKAEIEETVESIKDFDVARMDLELKEKATKQEVQQVTAQLAEKAKLKVFNEIPSPSSLGNNELGLVLMPVYPVYYDFNSMDGIPWDYMKFKNRTYEQTTGLLNSTNSYSRLEGNKGVIKVDKGTAQGMCVIENISTNYLDFKNGKKYRIKITMANNYVNDVNTGNTGITISPDVGAQTYYPDIGKVSDCYSLYLNPTTTNNGYIRAKVRKIVGKKQTYDNDIATNGGYAATSGERLVIPMGESRDFILEISATSIKLSINGTVYLDITEDLGFLANNPCRLSLWGSNINLNSVSTTHTFDNFIVEEVV